MPSASKVASEVPSRRGRGPFPKAAIVSAAWLAMLSSGSVVEGRSTTAAAPIEIGELEVVEAADHDRPLTQGGSATYFSLRLPEGASCPGDSAHDQWRTQSFIIPTTDDPALIAYGVAGPEGAGQHALYGVDTVPYAHQFLYPNDREGEPGLIPPIPPLSFAVFPPGVLADGDYRVGVACTYFRSTAVYWETEIAIQSDPDDEPAGFTWQVAPSAAGPASDTSATDWPVAGALAAAGVVAVAVLVPLLRRRSSRPHPVTTAGGQP